MRECALCREKYDAALKECPYCGCPADHIRAEDTGFGKTLTARFEFLSCEEELSPPAWRVKDRGDGRICVLRALPAGPDGRTFAKTLERLKSAHPQGTVKILQIHWSDEEADSWYRYEEAGLLTIRSMLERENPIGKEQAEKIGKEMRTVMDRLAKSGFSHGSLSLSSFALDADKVILREFGNGSAMTDDGERIRQIELRMLTGSWQEADGNENEGVGKRILKNVLSFFRGW